MPGIKLIAVDLDGTMLTSDRSIHPWSGEAVQRAVQRGVTVAFASGRIATTIGPFIEELRIVAPIVSCNGAYVLEADGTEIEHRPVSRSVNRLVVGYAVETGCHLNVYCRSDVYFSKESQWGELYLSRVRSLSPVFAGEEVLNSLEPTKMMIVDEPSALQNHRARLSESLRGEPVEIVVSEPEYLEFLAGGVNKASGLQALAARLGIDRSETAAIGDYHNDVEMLQWAGVSAAVMNAPAAVKEAADRIVASNCEGGVGEFIDSIV